ncbi:MAG: hypothetical protein ACOC2H_02345 [Spirochaetota bacterium]
MAIINTAIVLTAYIVYILSRLQDKNASSLASDLSFWAGVFLVFIPIYIILRIIMEIILAIINAAVTRSEEDPSFIDERDELIELKAVRISNILTGVGFIAALVTVVLKLAPMYMFIIIFVSFHLSEAAENGIKLYFYQRGVRR